MMRTPPPPAAEDVLCASDAPTFLRNLLEARKTKNPRYSLRSFARTLAIPSSTLNAMLKETRAITSNQALHLSSRLGLSKLEQAYFLLLVERAEAVGGDREKRVAARQRRLAWLIRAERGEEVDSLDFAPEWYHLALYVGVARLETFRREQVVELGARMGVDRETAGAAFDRMAEKGIFAPAGEGLYRRELQRVLLATEDSNADFRRVHFAMTERALAALDAVDATHRYSATEFVALDREAFGRVRELTNHYLDRAQFESNHNPGADVYCVSVHAFPLRKDRNEARP